MRKIDHACVTGVMYFDPVYQSMFTLSQLVGVPFWRETQFPEQELEWYRATLGQRRFRRAQRE